MLNTSDTVKGPNWDLGLLEELGSCWDVRQADVLIRAEARCLS